MLQPYIDQFLKMSEAQHRPGSTRKYRRVLAMIKDWKIPITTAKLENWRQERLTGLLDSGNGKSRRINRVTVTGEMALLQSFFSYCARHDFMPPVLFPKRLHYVRNRPKPLTDTEMAALVNACNTQREINLLLLALHAGLRRMELQTLEDTDIYDGMIHLRPKPQYDWVPKGWKECQIPLPPGVRINHPGLLFPTKNGQPTLHLIGELQAIAERAGIERRIYLHLLRHTFGTRLARSTDLRTTQELMRHSDISTTMLYVEPLRETAAVIERAFQSDERKSTLVDSRDRSPALVCSESISEANR